MIVRPRSFLSLSISYVHCCCPFFFGHPCHQFKNIAFFLFMIPLTYDLLASSWIAPTNPQWWNWKMKWSRSTERYIMLYHVWDTGDRSVIRGNKGYYVSLSQDGKGGCWKLDRNEGRWVVIVISRKDSVTNYDCLLSTVRYDYGSLL